MSLLFRRFINWQYVVICFEDIVVIETKLQEQQKQQQKKWFMAFHNRLSTGLYAIKHVILLFSNMQKDRLIFELKCLWIFNHFYFMCLFLFCIVFNQAWLVSISSHPLGQIASTDDWHVHLFGNRWYWQCIGRVGKISCKYIMKILWYNDTK